MYRRWLPPALLGLALASVAGAVPNPCGVNVRWANCLGDGGTSNRAFACNTNAGSERIVCSYQTDVVIPNVSGAEITIDIRANAASLPLWWQFKNAGTPAG